MTGGGSGDVGDLPGDPHILQSIIALQHLPDVARKIADGPNWA